MKKLSLSLKEACSLILSSQKLSGPSLNPRQVIEHLGYVQIDTISVIERAHHHVFWSRSPNYLVNDLAKLVESREVFEYWSHAASYLPMSEYRYSLPMKEAFAKRTSAWFPKDPKVMKFVLNRIKNEGPLRSKDFENSKGNRSGWWDWKPAKKALERLFLEGQLEISRREGFQKVYDLPERVIPSNVNSKTPAPEEYHQFLVRRTLRHHGVASVGEMTYLRRREHKALAEIEIAKMLSRGELVEVAIEGVREKHYALPKTLNKTLQKTKSKVLILSPFDNLVIQRKKLKTFFDFDYQIECYVPENKRKYGYFCLPIFIDGKAVGRIDCKADRKTKVLKVVSAHPESKMTKLELLNQIESKLESFAKFNGCAEVQVAKIKGRKKVGY